MTQDTPAPPKRGGICVVAGEASGDLQAAHLVEALKKQDPHLWPDNCAPHFWGAAGPMMRQAGVVPLVPLEDLAVMGFAEILSKYTVISAAFHTLVDAFDRLKPEAVILVDYPGFNLKLAREAWCRGITVHWHIPPKVWSHGAERVETLRRVCHGITSILPFEMDFFRSRGLPVTFVGNPLKDGTAQWRRTHPRLEIPGTRQVALLPGSRKSELKAMLPLLLDSWVLLLEKAQQKGLTLRGKIPAAVTLGRAYVQERIAQHLTQVGKPEVLSTLDIQEGATWEMLNQADYAWVCSGTATLETAFFHVPMAVVYRLNPISYAIAKNIITVPWIGLVNLAAQKTLVPEFIQHEANPQSLVAHAASLLFDDAALKGQREQLKQVEEMFPEGFAERAAQDILRVIGRFHGTAEHRFAVQNRMGYRPQKP